MTQDSRLKTQDSRLLCGDAEVAGAGLVQQTVRAGVGLRALIAGDRGDLVHQVARLAHAERSVRPPALEHVAQPVRREADPARAACATEEILELLIRRIVESQLEAD